MACEVGENGSALKNSEVAAIMVNDDGDPAVGTVLGEPGLFLYVGTDVNALDGVGFVVSGLQFFEEDGDFVAVGSAPEEG